MNNEPYGWVKNGEYVLYIEKPDSVITYRPLYTHPVKELTNEEIEKVWLDDVGLKNTNYADIVRFARAILRKAQEK